MQDPAKVRSLFSAIAGRYDLANHLLSLGLDRGWRRRIARDAARLRPRRILDLATGSGDLALALRRTCPGATVVAADFCLPMLEVARAKALPCLVAADGLQLPFADGTFDLLTVAFGLRNMRSYPEALREFARVIAPGGRVMILDFSLPPFPVRPLYRLYLHRLLPSIAGALTGHRDAYSYLGASIESFPSGAAMENLLAASGFADPTTAPMALGVVSLYTARREKAFASRPDL